MSESAPIKHLQAAVKASDKGQYQGATYVLALLAVE